jgi:hypothetical protein
LLPVVRLDEEIVGPSPEDFGPQSFIRRGRADDHSRIEANIHDVPQQVRPIPIRMREIRDNYPHVGVAIQNLARVAAISCGENLSAALLEEFQQW